MTKKTNDPRPRTALITGVTGQDGSYLAEYLLEKGYQVYGLVRRSSNDHHLSRNQPVLADLRYHVCSGDITCYESILSTLATVSPDEIYHLAANSFVQDSFSAEYDVFQTNQIGTLNLLRAIRFVSPHSKLYFAGTSEMYGNPVGYEHGNFDERSPMRPVSPYGIAKLAAYNLCRYYRDAYGLFIACGILFNHESPRRGHQFVTRKITREVARICSGVDAPIRLGNIDAKRDWGYAPEYVIGMHRMLQQENPRDYVLCTGYTYSVADFIRFTWESAYDMGISPEGRSAEGLYKEYTVSNNAADVRANELHVLKGCNWKAADELGWIPKMTARQVAEKMLDHDWYQTMTSGPLCLDRINWKEVEKWVGNPLSQK